MDVKSGYPWWPVRNGLLRDYLPLRHDVECEVAIIGAGITGALIAAVLVKAGFDVVVTDRRDVAWGSTSASTALLQYEIDTELTELAEMFGMAQAVLAYKACRAAVDELGEIAGDLDDTGFARCESLYFASSPRHLKRLRAEYAVRRENGFDVRWLDAAELRKRAGFSAPAALLSRPAANVDPYRLTHSLLARCSAAGMRLYDRSEITDIKCESTGLTLRTHDGPRVKARCAIVAAGYETGAFLPTKVSRNRSSYALVSEPLEPFPEALRRLVVWETARPYLYWRSSEDGRLIVGGEDDAIDNPTKRDLKVSGKCAKLLKRMHRLFPSLPLKTGFAWAGTFAETKDGLPYFGAHPKCDPRIKFAMAYGGNGITYSTIGARILCDGLQGRRHPLAELFGFARTRG